MTKNEMSAFEKAEGHFRVGARRPPIQRSVTAASGGRRPFFGHSTSQTGSSTIGSGAITEAHFLFVKPAEIRKNDYG